MCFWDIRNTGTCGSPSVWHDLHRAVLPISGGDRAKNFHDMVNFVASLHFLITPQEVLVRSQARMMDCLLISNREYSVSD